MNKWLKILFGVGAVLILLVVTLLVLATVLITPERVKETILPLAEENIQRKIELGDIEVSLLSGIEIHGLKLYEKNGQDLFVSTDMVRLKYQLLPLLAMKVVIDEVRLEKPNVRVVRYKDGQFNYSDLVDGEDSEPTPGETQPQIPQGSESTSSENDRPISLLVSNLLLQDGQMVFLDHVLNDKAPYRYEISGLQVAAKGVTLTGKIPLSVQCQLNESPLTLDGHINLQPFSVDFDIAMKALDVVAFSPYFKESLPGNLGGAKLSLEATLLGSFEDFGLKGSVSLADLDLLLDSMPEAPLENADVNVDFDLLLAHKKDLLQVHSFDLDFNGIKLGVVGKIDTVLTRPTLNLTLSVPDLKIRQAIDAVPQSLIGDVSSLDPAGSLSAEASLAGSLENPQSLLKSAQVDLEGVQATAGGQRPAFSGRLLLSGDHLKSEGLQVRLGDNNADIKLTASRLFTPPAVVTADITSKRFLLEPLLLGSASPAAAAEEVVTASNRGQGDDKELGPFDIPVHATGTISVAEALWKDLTIKDFIARYELKDNIFKLSQMDGNVAGGSFRTTASVDLRKKGLAYSANLDLNAVQADPLLTAFLPKAAGSLLGAMNLSVDLDGRGSQWKSMSRNLSGAGDMLVSDGRLASPGLVKGFSSIVQLSDLKDIQFENFKAQFKVVNGKVKLDSQLTSERLKLSPQGSIGLDGSLDLGLDTRLSPELSAKLDKGGSVTRYLEDQDGWTQLPLLLTGDFSSPRFGLDPKGINRQASKALGQELNRQLDKLFRPKDSSSTTETQSGEEAEPAEDPGRKLLQDSLQKLFGN
ncbi:AsmA family protein [Deltaproteobacteria bacterium IMCC39524]|nr:AsmA family protein [Deltaproteobacteria bacterium IMCC39524]